MDQSPAPTSDRLFSPEPLDLGWLETLKLDLQLNVAELKLPRLGIENLEAQVKIADGGLKLKPLRAAVGGGESTGELALNAGEAPRLSGEVLVKDLDLAQMLKMLDLPDTIRGKTGLKLKLEGRGESPSQLAASLEGRFSLAMQDGQIASRYLKMAELYGLELTNAFLKLFKVGSKQKSEFVQIECLVVRFEISDGIAQSNALVFDTERAGVVGKGEIDLKSEQLNITLEPVSPGGDRHPRGGPAEGRQQRDRRLQTGGNPAGSPNQAGQKQVRPDPWQGPGRIGPVRSRRTDRRAAGNRVRRGQSLCGGPGRGRNDPRVKVQ
jgi:uncharacterized protein involved in outer membrane biogenesis